MVSGIIIGQEDPSSVITLDAIITNVQGVFFNYHKKRQVAIILQIL